MVQGQGDEASFREYLESRIAGQNASKKRRPKRQDTHFLFLIRGQKTLAKR